jgi:hypothetical protein
MDVDPDQKTSEGTQDASNSAESSNQQKTKTSQSQSQSHAKARVRIRKKDFNGGGDDNSKRRCVSTACIGMVIHYLI